MLFEDGLYFEIAQHAVALADELRLGCRDAGLEMLYDTAANQLFPIMPDAVIAKLQEKIPLLRLGARRFRALRRQALHQLVHPGGEPSRPSSETCAQR